MLYSIGGYYFMISKHTYLRKKKKKKRCTFTCTVRSHGSFHQVVTYLHISLQDPPLPSLPFDQFYHTIFTISLMQMPDLLMDQYYDARCWRKKRLDFRLGNDAERAWGKYCKGAGLGCPEIGGGKLWG